MTKLEQVYYDMGIQTGIEEAKRLRQILRLTGLHLDAHSCLEKIITRLETLKLGEDYATYDRPPKRETGTGLDRTDSNHPLDGI